MNLSLRRIGRSGAVRRWCGSLALLAMVLKAAIPVGFMVAAVDGHASLILCPSGIHRHSATVVAADMPAMAGMEMGVPAPHVTATEHGPGDAHAAHAAQHAAAECPFALASGAALASASEEPSARYFELVPRAAPIVLATVPIAPPPRHEAPRGPPSLA